MPIRYELDDLHRRVVVTIDGPLSVDDMLAIVARQRPNRRGHTGPSTICGGRGACPEWRKIMFGTRSADGELAVARLLTVTRTCQLQQLNALVYLTAAIRCHRRRQAVASLVPRLQLKPERS